MWCVVVIYILFFCYVLQYPPKVKPALQLLKLAHTAGEYPVLSSIKLTRSIAISCVECPSNAILLPAFCRWYPFTLPGGEALREFEYLAQELNRGTTARAQTRTSKQVCTLIQMYQSLVYPYLINFRRLTKTYENSRGRSDDISTISVIHFIIGCIFLRNTIINGNPDRTTANQI